MLGETYWLFWLFKHSYMESLDSVASKDIELQFGCFKISVSLVFLECKFYNLAQSWESVTIGQTYGCFWYHQVQAIVNTPG